MESLIILGAREHAKVVWATLHDALAKKWRVVGFLDDNPQLHGKKLLGLPILGPIDLLDKLSQSKKIQGALVGISCNHMPARAGLFQRIQKLGLKTPLVISPSAHVHRTARVGAGSVICSGVVIHAFARLGSNCVVYSNSTVEHECVLEDNVYLGPGVCFCASVQVGSGTFVGTGANVICCHVGEDAIVGAGAAVAEDVPDGAIVAGVPARTLRKRSVAERKKSFLFRDHSK